MDILKMLEIVMKKDHRGNGDPVCRGVFSE